MSMTLPPARFSEARPGSVAGSGAPSCVHEALHEDCCVPGRLCPACYAALERCRAAVDLQGWLDAWGGRARGASSN